MFRLRHSSLPVRPDIAHRFFSSMVKRSQSKWLSLGLGVCCVFALANINTSPAFSRDLVAGPEAQHRAKFDAALAPLLNTKVSKADGELLRRAKKAINKRNVETANSLKSQLLDPVAAKLVDWYRLRAGLADLSEIVAFLNNNPAWPNRWLLRKRIDQKLFAGKTDAKWVVSYYQANPPEQGISLAALASAHLQLEDRKSATAAASKAWRTHDFDKDDELDFMKRLGFLLTPADHKWRFDRLILDKIRWKKARNRRAAIVQRQIPRLAKSERRKAKARLAAFRRSKSAGKLLSGLPSEEKPDWGLVFQRIQYLRRAKQKTKAAKLMLGAPTSLQDIVNPDGWWAERRANAYAALDAGNHKLAYELVRDAGPLSVNQKNAQSFLAGWLALRYLSDAPAAIKHFTSMTNTADGPLSRSKSAYWLARAHEATGDTAAAKHAYQKSAQQTDTFHGQLARQKLSANKVLSIEITPPTSPSQDQISTFLAMDAAKAAVIAVKAKVGRSISRPFLANLGSYLKSEGEVALVAHLTQALGDTQQSLRVGKKAIGRGMNMLYYAYPVHAFPKYKPLRKPPETAFLLGIARQESEFNTQIRSGAGARGILQVMPITARHVCRDYKIKCNIGRLQLDESYNTMIASAYTADRMGEFGGSYVLGLAGYNAGPGRARQWIKRFGDPRSAHIDAVDWIERMPFRETRNYVAKVLSNIQIYRARLGASGDALRLTQDLARAQAGGVSQTARHAPGSRSAKARGSDG